MRSPSRSAKDAPVAEVLRMPKRLLIVDDEPRNLAVLEGHLAPLGHHILRATDGPKALELIASHKPDLVLLDVVMPHFDGVDVLTHIRARNDGDEIPVILVTAHHEREQRLRGLEAGADDFLEKPIDAPVLLRRVGTLLKLKSARDALRDSRDKLAERNDALQRLQREQRELTAFIVHDLKNPLSALCMNIDYSISRIDPTGVDVRTSLLQANQAAWRLRTMIDDILVVSRLEEARFPLHLERIALSDMFDNVTNVHAPLAEERGIALEIGDSHAIEVRADRRLLQRVLDNVLDNSLRYTPSGGKIAVQSRRGSDVEIAISNNGPTIPVSERDRIFEKFVRGDGEQRDRANAGLGLYFCKRALDALGGQIEVTESEGWSTSFVIHLPSAEGPALDTAV